jgi:GNAT superfamily N-acetyltransferase
MSDKYEIRRASYEEMKYPVEWAAIEGWNPGLYDIDSFYYTDPDGYFLGILNGEPIACISAVSYGDFGFLGFYIVKPEHRGKGYGIQLWRKAVEYLTGKNVGLDGVVAQQKNYMKSGFNLAYQNIRYQGKGRGKEGKYPDLIDLAEVPFTKVVAYDKALFPAERRSF